MAEPQGERIARLETRADATDRDIGDLKTDVKYLVRVIYSATGVALVLGVIANVIIDYLKNKIGI